MGSVGSKGVGGEGSAFTLDRTPSAAFDRESFSEPPRSAKNSRDRFSAPSARCTKLSITRECAREERSFMAVAALRLHFSAAARRRLACAPGEGKGSIYSTW